MKQELFIGEIAELLGVSKDTLRIYEEQGLICPKRDENGFRRYGEEELYRLITVKVYRENAFPMKEIRRLMEKTSRRGTMELLEAQIQAERILRMKKRLNEMLAANTGKPLEQIERDTERDNFMSAEQAKEYGLIDKVIAHR